MLEKTLNLIPKKSFEEFTLSKKIFFWMIGIGRIIVVGTELIAILVWLSRFKLDYDISLLNDTLEKKQEVLINAKDLEENVRLAQKKIKLIKTVRDNKLLYSKALNNFTSLIPGEVQLKTLSLNPQTLTFNIRARSASAFAKLIVALLESTDFENITLTASTFDPKEGNYNSSLSIDILPEAFK